MPFGFGIGNHRAFILDIPMEALVGESPVRLYGLQGDASIVESQGAAKHTSRALKATLNTTA